jgi:glycosyltransferase involved in cell wall biosynthesis
MLAARRPGRPTVLIRNAADLEGIELPLPERPWPKQDRVLLFPGTPQPGNSAATLWEAIRRHLTVAGAGPRCRFAFLGLHADMHALVRSSGIGDRVDDLGPQPHHRALALMQGADGILVPVRATPASAGVIPAKIYEAIALRKFVLLVADPQGDAAALVRSYGRGATASSSDPDSVARALDAFARTPPEDADFVIPPPFAGWSRTAAAQDLDRALRGLESGEPFNPTCP